MMTIESQAVADLSAPVELDNAKPEATIPEATAAAGDVEQKQVEPEKTFTQAEVDALVQKRLLKEERRVHRRVEQQMREQQQADTLRSEPKRENFQDDQAYMQAQVERLAEQRATQKLAEREHAAEAERRSESFLEKAEKASERYSDFQAVVSNPALSINEAMAEFISESDQGADVAYFLGKNPIKAAHISQMSPVKAARELTRIESELASKPQATPSKAPEPIRPVGQRGASSTSSLPNDSDDVDTWMRKERERTRHR